MLNRFDTILVVLYFDDNKQFGMSQDMFLPRAAITNVIVSSARRHYGNESQDSFGSDILVQVNAAYLYIDRHRSML